MQVRSFVFTWNNYKEDSAILIQSEFSDARYGVIGYEIGESGTPHLQGFIQLNKRRTLSTIGGKFPWHVENTKGTPKQASDYCKKGENFTEWGNLSDSSAQGSVGKDRWHRVLHLAKTGQLEECAQEYPSEYLHCLNSLNRVHVDNLSFNLQDNRKAIWLVGRPGCGKSRFAFNEYKEHYPKNCNKWWDGYKDDHKVVILDDIGHEHKVLGYHLKRWTDRYSCIGEVKGGSVPLNYDLFIITSNYRIEDIWKDDNDMKDAILRRFKVIIVYSLEESLEGFLSIKTSDDKLINKFNILD